MGYKVEVDDINVLFTLMLVLPGSQMINGCFTIPQSSRELKIFPAHNVFVDY